MRHIPICRFAVAALALTLISPVSSAADAFYLGTWKITSAVVAPWWAHRTDQPRSTEMKSLVGKTITITRNAIRGPRELACSPTRHEVKQYTADMLFQGLFGEMHLHDKSADPAKIAADLGFRGSHWKTLETGCGVEVDYHFIDDATAAIGLNDYVYILKKQ